METRDLLENSRKKLAKKHLDLIAANNLREEGAGFGTATNLLTLITAERETPLPLQGRGRSQAAGRASGPEEHPDLAPVTCPSVRTFSRPFHGIRSQVRRLLFLFFV